MKDRLLLLMPVILLAVLVVTSTDVHGDDNPGDPSPPTITRRCKSGGAFVAWETFQQAVISQSGKMAACDAGTGEMSASTYVAQTEDGDAARQAAWQSLKATFPKSVSQKDPVTGTNIEWKNAALVYTDAPSLEMAVYIAQGRSASGHASGPAGSRAGLFALLHRSADKYRLLPLELSDQDSKKWASWSYPIGGMAGRLDAQSGQTFLFFLNKKLGPDAYQPSWAPFDAWWFDPNTVSLTHIVLPDGPWYADVASDPLFRPLGCFSCGCDCYRHYEIKVGGGSVFISIAATYGALHDATTGIYILKGGAPKWRKIAGTDTNTKLSQISGDGCHIALNKSGGVEVLPLCGSVSL